MVLLEANYLVIWRGWNIRALDSNSLTIKKGEFLAIMMEAFFHIS